MGVIVDPMRGCAISEQGFADSLDAILASLTMECNVFDDDDCVIDDETDGGGETAEGHEVETLARWPIAR
jgi:hypothetical protein